MPRLGAAAMIRRAAWAPARCPCERGSPLEEAHRPFPSEIIATWRGRAVMVRGTTEVGGCRTMGEVCMVWLFFSPPRITTATNYSVLQSIQPKKTLLPFACGADQRFHMIQIALERTPPGGRQPVFRFRQTPVERLGAHDVVGFFEFARMNAQVAVGGLQHGLQLVKRKRAIDRQCADDAQPHPL